MSRLNRFLPDVACYTLPVYKVYIILALSILTIASAFTGYGMQVIWQVFIAVTVGGILDYAIIRWRSENPYFPSGAIISSMIIANLINPGAVRETVIVVILMLILKHLFKPSFRNIFNPAVFAVAVATLIPQLNVSSVWWAASTELTLVVGITLLILIKRWPNGIAFLLTYWVLDKGWTLISTGDVSITLAMLSGPVAYFASYMVIEPVTTPKTYKNMAIFGGATAVLAFAASFSSYLLANSFHLYIPLLFMNLMMRLLPNRMLE